MDLDVWGHAGMLTTGYDRIQQYSPEECVEEKSVSCDRHMKAYSESA